MTKFNRSKAAAEFKSRMETEKRFFLSNGMSDTDTEIILEFSKEQYRADRIYYEHNISLYSYTEGMEEEGKSPFIVMSFDIPAKKNVETEYIYLNWIETVKNEKLRTYIDSLKIEEKIILTEITLNKRSQCEVAERLGITRQTVAKIHKRIISEIKNLML